MPIDAIYQQLTVPDEESHAPVRAGEGRFMHDWIKQHRLHRTLETGFAFGASAACIMSAHSNTHTCMDPFQSKDFNDLGLRNIAKLGLQDRLRFLPEFSHVVLPKLLAERRRYDFAFIDGNHLYDGIFLDFYYVDLLLDQNGYVLFHDSWMRGTQLVASFIRRNRADYRAVKTPIRNLLMFQKVGCDRRRWDHFRGFYTLRSSFSHPLIRWLINHGFLSKKTPAEATEERATRVRRRRQAHSSSSSNR